MQETDQHTTEQQHQSRSESPASTDPETLATAVRVQVEYYFSKENLRTDTFLQSKMDANSAVPLATVMAFPKILALTRDTQVVIKSLESSSVVVLADGKIKPKGSGRSTIILREIPSDSSEESIREIFNYPGARSISSIRSEIGDTWFVTMESEEDAKDTIMDLKLKKRSFNGVAVKARLKTDAGLRSYYTASTVLPIAYPGMTFQPYGMMDTQGGAAAYNYDAAASPSPTSPQSKDRVATATGASATYRKEGSDGDDAGRRDGRERGANRNNPKGHTNTTGAGSNRRQGDNNGAKGSGGRGRKENAAPPPPPPTIEINSAADFPPLAPTGSASHTGEHETHTTTALPATFSGILSQQQTVASEPVVIPPCGYQGPYTRYSIDDILLIVSGIKDAKIPSTIALAEHSAALVTSPNTDLLLRQRTFSIDETREQMQLGRPVQREAVITGAVDYGSFIYGELDNSGHGDRDHPTSASGEKKSTKAGGSWAGVLMKAGPPPPPADSKPVGTPAKAPAPVTDKTAAAASTPSAGKGDSKKGGEKKAKNQQDGAKKDGKPAGAADGEGKKNRRRRAGSNGDGKAAEEGDNSAGVPSSWGGRPTFSQILKQQEEAAAAEAAAHAAAGTTPPAVATTAPASAPKKPTPASQHPNASGNRPQGGHKNQDKSGAPHKSHSPAAGTAAGAAAKNKLVTNPDGTWVRDKLPPR